MRYRINERNTGSMSLECEPKKRRAKKEQITDSDRDLMRRILFEVQQSLAYDPDLSDCGPGLPQAIFSDSAGGGITLSMTREKFEQLSAIIFEKL